MDTAIAGLVVSLVVSVLPQPSGNSIALLPAAITDALTSQYRGWRIAAMNEELLRSLRTLQAGAQPNVLAGDFDGNGLTDYAVLIEYPVPGNDDSAPRLSQVVAFLQTSFGFRASPLIRAQSFRAEEGLHLWPVAKGSKGYDLNTDREFVYERDAIAVLLDSRGPCTTFVYRDGKFHGLWTCD